MARAGADKEAAGRVEAALYAAGRPLRMEELMRASGTESRAKTAEIVADIAKRAKSAFRAIEVAKLPDGSYVFQLKPEFGSAIKRYTSRPLMTRATLKTLSYVVYSQPVSSKQLVETRGTGVYSHLKELRQLGFVSYQNIGRLKLYTTTEKFQKYFGVDGGPEALRERLLGRRRKRPPQGPAQAGPQA